MPLSTYLVRWSGVTEEVHAVSPENAAEKAVARHDYDPDEVHGVEVAVYEKVRSRHDVIVNEEVFEDA